MRKSRLLVTAVVSAVVLGLFAAPTSASATPPTDVDVQLVSPSGTSLHLSGVEVVLYAKQSGVYNEQTDSVTDVNGKTTFSVPAGIDQRVATSNTGSYLGGSKSGIKVKSGKTVTVKLAMPVGATVQGVVSQNGSALSSATVELVNSSGRVIGSATTNGTGNYQVGPVGSGSYRVVFNARKNVLPSPAGEGATWSYWKNAKSWSSAKTVTLKQQSAHAAATHLNAINGSVSTTSATLEADISLYGITSGSWVDIVSQHPGEDFEFLTNGSATQATTELLPGKYRIAIQGPLDHIMGDYPLYWYRGEGLGPTTTQSKAKWITIGTSNVTVHFVNNPAPIS